MSPAKTLSEVGPGQTVTVERLLTQGAMRRRLLDIGLTPGESVSSLFGGAFGGPAAYYIQGAVIALRKEDAETVVVS